MIPKNYIIVVTISFIFINIFAEAINDGFSNNTLNNQKWVVTDCNPIINEGKLLLISTKNP